MSENTPDATVNVNVDDQSQVDTNPTATVSPAKIHINFFLKNNHLP
jgi:hypothetical protein